MVTIVCFCNLLITLVNCLVAWYLWKARRKLADGTRTLVVLEEAARLVLVPAPLAISRGQQGGMTIKQRYRTLSRLLRQLRALLSLLSVGYTFWQQQARWRLVNLGDRPSNLWGRFM